MPTTSADQPGRPSQTSQGAPLTRLNPGEVRDPAPGAVVVDTRDRWSADEIAQLGRWIADGEIAVVHGPVDDPAWQELTGAAPADADVAATELTVEAADHPLARNLSPSVVRVDGAALGRPLDGATALATAVVRLRRPAVLTARGVGEGLVLWSGLPQGAVPLVDRLVDRILRLGAGSLDRGTEQRTHGIGIVGYGQHGGMGWLHGTAAGAVHGLRLGAIAELDERRLADAGRRFPEAGLHGSVEGLLEDDHVDVVVIATPPSTHHELTAKALRAGNHVVVEKPMCFTAEQADELIALAEAEGRTLTIHQNRRWDADFLAIRRVIDEGRLGEVFNIETFVGGFEHPCPLWHSDRGVSGGRLYDWGAHLIDQTLQLYGRGPTQVHAVGHGRVWHDVTNLDQVRVRMGFDDGTEAEFLDSDVLAVRRPKYVIQGTKGTLVGRYAPVVEETVTPDSGYQRTEHHHAEGPARLSLSTHEPGWGLHEADIPVLPAAPHPFHRALADHLQLGDPAPVDPREVRTVTAVLEAAHASAHDGGRTITLDG